MSFKVSDKIVEIYGNYGGLVLEVSAFFKGANHPKPIVFFEYDYTVCDDLAEDFRHATPEEIAAGHRIDEPACEHEWNEATSNGDKYRFFVCKNCDSEKRFVPFELFGNSEDLEVLEMIDVSPNCGVSEIVNNWTTDEQIIEHQLAVIDGLKARIEELVEVNLNLEGECVQLQKRIDIALHYATNRKLGNEISGNDSGDLNYIIKALRGDHAT